MKHAWHKIHWWKGLFINQLISDMKYTSYLELGVGREGNTWNYVFCSTKRGVDTHVVGDNIVNLSTDEYFQKYQDTFDVIYIDACHEKTQVYRDYISSYSVLNRGGIMLFHDVHPNCEASTSMTGCGDVYELWMNMCDAHSDLRIIAENVGSINEETTDDGLGVLFKDLHSPVLRNSGASRGWNYYSDNRHKYVDSISVNYQQILENLKS